LEDLAEGAFADQFEDLKVFGSKALLSCAVEGNSHMYLSSNEACVLVVALELVPSFMLVFVVFKVDGNADVSKESLVVYVVVD